MKHVVLISALMVLLTGCSSSTTPDSSVGELGHGPDLDVDVSASDRSPSPDRPINLDLTPHDGDGSPPVPPLFVSLTASPPDIEEGGSTTITAVLSDPNGDDDVVSGELTFKADGKRIGGFVTTKTPGTFWISIPWLQFIPEEAPSGGGAHVVEATFTDRAGLTVQRTISIGYRCQVAANGICNYACQDLLTSAIHCGKCKSPCTKGEVCKAGLCGGCSYTAPQIVDSASSPDVGIVLNSTVARVCYASTANNLSVLKLATASTAAGSTWSPQVVDTAPQKGVELWGCAIATDKNDKLYISYTKYGIPTANTFMLADNVGGSWRLTTIAPNARWVGSSVAVDGAARVHLAYGVETTANTYVARYVVASALNTPSVQLSTPVDYVGRRLSMVVDATDTAHLLLAGFGIFLATPPASAALLEAKAIEGAVTLDPSSKPVVVYYHSTGGRLESLTDQGGAWKKGVILQGFGAMRISAAVDGKGKLHVLYTKGSVGKTHLYYITNASGAWPKASKDLGSVHGSSTLAVDATGTAHIVYPQSAKVMYIQATCH